MVLPPLRIVVLVSAYVLNAGPGQAAVPRVEAGLEGAVRWWWRVEATEEKDWGLPVDLDEDAEGPAGGPARPAFEIGPGEYVVKRGDALAKISRKSGITVDQLKEFNELSGDLIRIGQVLKIPTLKEVLAMAPPPPPVAEVVGEVVQEEAPANRPPPPLPRIDTLEQLIEEATLHQVLLDREGFGIGPIDGERGTVYETTLAIYRDIHGDLGSPEAVRQRAVEVVGRAYSSYRLKRSDYRFIAAAEVADAPPDPTYEDLVGAEFLAYRTAWEFVAERYHCDEKFLRSLNPKIKEPVMEGVEFKVPNVIPFEVESCFSGPLQPEADPGNPVVATMVGVTRLEIRRGGVLVAVMPVSRARPGLYGKGAWTILGATPGPRLATRKESTSGPFSNEADDSSAAAEQVIAAGPRNPVGVIWIDLAKEGSTTPLPYGLHGTSIPGRMKSQESIGGFRLANWDIARAVRMLPKGTVLEWK